MVKLNEEKAIEKENRRVNDRGLEIREIFGKATNLLGKLRTGY